MVTEERKKKKKHLHPLTCYKKPFKYPDTCKRGHTGPCSRVNPTFFVFVAHSELANVSRDSCFSQPFRINSALMTIDELQSSH